ncbi:MAG: deoxyribose-phosphate aldolase, partial [Candidatus Kapaibacterium sp.]
MNALELAACIDHTALNPETTERDIKRICAEAAEHGFASVCVMPWYVLTAREALAEYSADIVVCTVVGFPNGAHLSEVKQLEARCALDDGALELDMMMNLSAFKSGRRDEVQKDIEAIVDIAHERDALL